MDKDEKNFEKIEKVMRRFRRITRFFSLFHLCYFFVFIIEILCLLLTLPFLAKNPLFAIFIGVISATFFSYFVLKFYLQIKKPEQLLTLKERLILNESEESALTLIYLWISRLEGEEYRYYPLPLFLKKIVPFFKKFSAWCHWSDVHLMKETLHTHCIQQQLEEVKRNPTDLHLHAALAKGYLAFYEMYRYRPELEISLDPFIKKKYNCPDFVERFQKIALCAVEELKIILHYKPEDLWSLKQLAQVYHHLNQKEEAKKVYEQLLHLAPQEREIRFQLGVLYFQLGLMVQGLKMYEDFYKTHDPYAEKLIHQYDLFYNDSVPIEAFSFE